MADGKRRARVREDLRAPIDVVLAAWPRSRGGRRVMALLVPIFAISLVAVLWVLGIVVFSVVAAIGVEPVDLEGSDQYLRDGVLYLATGGLTVLVLGVLSSLWRSALDDAPRGSR